MSYRSLAPGLVLAGLSWVTPTITHADDTIAPNPVPPDPIINGQDADVCAWPTTVVIGGGTCTGTLIHPELVLYAAHCGGSGDIRFGETASGSVRIPVEFCRTNPGYQGTNDQDHDWAFCKLAERVDWMPVTPPIFGCETNLLVFGAEVFIAGFGAPGSGRKSWGQANLNSVQPMKLTMGGGGDPGVCPGDSGGPAFMEMPDGTFRTIGIASTVTGGCGGEGTHSRADTAMAWVEQESGLDLTPCFDPDGTWNPTSECWEFLATGEVGHGTWNNLCEGTPVGPPSATCGDAFGSDDDVAPEVSITSPADGENFDTAPLDVPVDIDATDADSGVRRVWLRIGGTDLGDMGIYDTEEPYGFSTVTFPKGIHEIVALAEDWGGNITESDAVTIGVGEEIPPPPETGTGASGTDEGDDGSGTDDGATGTGTAGGSAAGDSKGCNCAAEPTGLGWLPLAFLIAPLRLRRR